MSTLKHAIKLETEVYDSVMDIKETAENFNDYDISQWIDPIIGHQVKSVEDFRKLLTVVEKFSEDESGLYQYDKLL
ncbi:MAG: hypothetical protein MHPSP_001189 [Paramarteilia canceri]